VGPFKIKSQNTLDGEERALGKKFKEKARGNPTVTVCVPGLSRIAVAIGVSV